MDELAVTSGRRLRICHIAATTNGASWIHEQLRELRDVHGFEVAAILNGESGSLVDRLKADGIPVLHADFDFTSSLDLFALPRKVWALTRLLRQERFDLVQTHLFHSMVIGRVAAFFADVPVSLSMIAGPFHLEAYTPRWIDKATVWMDTAVIASCEFTRTLYRGMGVPARRIELVYYGPDETRFQPAATTPAGLREQFGWAPDTPLIGMVAYFYAELPTNRWIPPAVQGRSVKCQEDLIRAMPVVLAQWPDAKLVLVGSGWEEGGTAHMERMKRLVTELGLDDSIVFTGFRTDIPRVLLDLDVAVQASASENLGGTIESLLMTCPTVATRVGGMTDSVIDGVTGVLVEPGSPEALAAGIQRLLGDRGEARRLGLAGRERMLAAFTLRSTGASLARIYRTKLASASKGYRPLLAGPRFIIGATVSATVALRYAIIDAWLLPAWDYGWRPWHRPRSFAATVLHRIRARLGRLASRGSDAARSMGSRIRQAGRGVWETLRERVRQAAPAIAEPAHPPAPREAVRPQAAAPRVEVATAQPAAPVEVQAEPARTTAGRAAVMVKPAPPPAPPLSEHPLVLRLGHGMTHLKHRTWYRFLAFVGRNSSFGLRARLRALVARGGTGGPRGGR